MLLPRTFSAVLPCRSRTAPAAATRLLTPAYAFRCIPPYAYCMAGNVLVRALLPHFYHAAPACRWRHRRSCRTAAARRAIRRLPRGVRRCCVRSLFCRRAVAPAVLVCCAALAANHSRLFCRTHAFRPCRYRRRMPATLYTTLLHLQHAITATAALHAFCAATAAACHVALLYRAGSAPATAFALPPPPPTAATCHTFPYAATRGYTCTRHTPSSDLRD